MKSLERDALAALYEATGGLYWRRSDNWLTLEPLGSWHGVCLDARGRVIGLNLGWNELSGSIPGELGSLISLEWLALQGNKLTGSIPLELGELAGLEELNVSGNALAGPIPRELTQLSSLRVFLFADTELCFTRDTAPWLATVADVAGSDRACTDRDALGQIFEKTGGERWTRSDNWLTDAPVNSWYGVSADRTDRVTGLELGQNGLTGTIPRELCALAHVKSLLLPNNDLSGQIPRELGSLADLEELSLSGNKLSGPIPRELARLGGLKKLLLRGNGLDGRIPPELGSLAKLMVLNVSDNALSGSIPRELGGLGSLEWLSLAGNALTGFVPPELARLPSLEWVYLHDNNLSDPLALEPDSLDDANLREVIVRSEDPYESASEEYVHLPSLRVFRIADSPLDLTGDMGEQPVLVTVSDITGSERCCTDRETTQFLYGGAEIVLKENPYRSWAADDWRWEVAACPEI